MSFSDELQKRLTDQEIKTLVRHHSEALLKTLLAREQIDQEQVKDRRIIAAMRRRLELDLESAIGAVATIAAAEGHMQENEEMLDALTVKDRNTLTPLINFDEVEAPLNPRFTGQFLEIVEEKTFKAGIKKVDPERLREIWRWLNEAFNE